MMLAKLHNILRLGFIEPFRSPERFMIYFAAMIGDASIMAASVFIAFNLYEYGPWALFGYFLLRFGFSNFIWIPYLFYAFEKLSIPRFILSLLILKIICLGGFIYFGDYILNDIHFINAAILGALSVVMSATFWIFHHRLMVQYSSDNNRGNEVSIAEFAINVGGLIGAVGGGWAIATIGKLEALTVFFILMWVAICIYAYLIYRKPFNKRPYPLAESYRIVTENIPRSLNTALYGANHFLLSFFAPVWMASIGLSGLGAGIVLALQSAVKFAASPFAGHLTNKNKAQETILGSSIKAAGWLPWIFTQSQILLLPSSALWFFGNHFYNVGTLSRWYAAKTGAHIGAREICQGVGRIVAVIIVIPLLYSSAPLFFAACFTIAASGILTSLAEQKFLSENKDQDR